MPGSGRSGKAALALARSEGIPALDGPRSPSDKAYAVIKLAVIRCEPEPGVAITESRLATQYRVGRAAVRAALKRLCQERLVEVAPQQRYRVAPVSIRHVNELFEIRALLEPAAESARAFLQLNTEFHILRTCCAIATNRRSTSITNSSRRL